ncbi:MAG: hypothetical protein A6F72_07735 [Cycloclasticus sp. symbiont of Poecilosclerida sp. N]|nr:MAG: hypothetical protein A6F72_07735 [Cycloclasticus sp. symbiont of Poecilosclerida sp. N]
MLMLTQLFACASLDILEADLDPKVPVDNVERVMAMNHWGLLGRIFVKHGRESWLAKLNWQHDLLSDNLTLSTSLGGVVAKLRYSEQGILVSDSDGNMRVTSNDELQSLLGYSPPLQHLKFWVRGVPSSAFDVERRHTNPLGAQVFNQDGWSVKLERFVLSADVVLPTRITLIKDELKIKLVVDDWAV